MSRPPFQFIARATNVVSILQVSVKRSNAIDPTVVEIFPRRTKGLVTDQIAGRDCRLLRFVVGISECERSKTNWRADGCEQLIFLSSTRFQKEGRAGERASERASAEGSGEVSTDCWESCLDLLSIPSDFVRQASAPYYFALPGFCFS